jgi:asparaginyl-tRNA synthetase
MDESGGFGRSSETGDSGDLVSSRERRARVAPPQSWTRPASHLETLLSSPWYRDLAAILSEVSFGTHSFFHAGGAQGALFPVTTGAVSSPMGRGSDSTPVQTTIDGQRHYLADSMQFVLELGVRLWEAPVYYIMPSFRGEPVDRRHLQQFFHVEAELQGRLDDVIALVEGYLYSLCQHLLDRCADSITRLAGGVSHVDELLARRPRPFPRLRFSQAVDRLGGLPSATREVAPGVLTLTAVGERALMDMFGDFLWITHMPRLSTPFYQAVEPETGYALNADLLAGIGEIAGAGQRVRDSVELQTNLDEHGVDAEDYTWYSQLKEIRPCVTSGFGMGVERFVLWLTRTSDIRNCTLLLRDFGRRLEP